MTINDNKTNEIEKSREKFLPSSNKDIQGIPLLEKVILVYRLTVEVVRTDSAY